MNTYGRGTIGLTPLVWDGTASGARALPGSWIVKGADGAELGLIPTEGDGDPYADALALLGLKRPHRASPVLAVLRSLGDWDAGDPWGSGMSWLGAVCDLAYVAGADIPESAGYRPGMGLWDGVTVGDIAAMHGVSADADLDPTDVTDAHVDLASAYAAGTITDADLTTAARILDRYLDAAKAAGRSY